MNMKFLLAAPLLAACALTSPLAMAASTDLQLKGEIAAGACNISAANNGSYDFGEITNDTLLPGARAHLPYQSNDFEVVCGVPTYIGVRLIDNRAGTRPSDVTGAKDFGLNVDSVGNPIGYFKVFGADTNLNGTGAGRVIYTTDAGNSWSVMNGGDGYLAVDRLHSFSAGAGGTAPVPVSSVTWPVQVRGVLESREKLDLSRGFDLDGSLTFELVYL